MLNLQSSCDGFHVSTINYLPLLGLWTDGGDVLIRLKVEF
jgi:hypothetical protein